MEYSIQSYRDYIFKVTFREIKYLKVQISVFTLKFLFKFLSNRCEFLEWKAV